MDTQTLIEQEAEAWVRAVKKAEEKIKAEEEEKKIEEEKAKKISRKLKIMNNVNNVNKLSGYVKISKELAVFLGETEGTEMVRMEVNRKINEYIKTNQLEVQDKTNGRYINADGKLSSLLKLKPGEKLYYFNLKYYIDNVCIQSRVDFHGEPNLRKVQMCNPNV